MTIKRILWSCACVALCSFVLINLTSSLSFTDQKNPVGSSTGIVNADQNMKTSILNSRTLLVKCDEGVTGEPNTGKYTHTNGSKVFYRYMENSGFTDLQVKLDNVPVPPKGVITMNGNHLLLATTKKKLCQYYLTVVLGVGNWRLIKKIPDSSAWYPCGTIVEYTYESVGPVVSIDGVEVCFKGYTSSPSQVCSGKIMMDKNHTISVWSH